jgi:hypothetical protein
MQGIAGYEKLVGALEVHSCLFEETLVVVYLSDIVIGTAFDSDPVRNSKINSLWLTWRQSVNSSQRA